MPKCVFFDIDNTLWNEQMIIPDSAMETVRKLHENGHLTFICSGRSRGNLNSEQLESLPFDGIIAACGNYIEVGGKVVYENLIAQDLLRESIEVMDRCGMPAVLEGTFDHWISEEGFADDPYVDYLYRVLGDAAHPLRGYEDRMRINKISTMILPTTDYKTIKETLFDRLTFLEHPFKIVEMVPHGTSKALGIRRVCDLLGIANEDTYGLGDSINDLEMLEEVGHGIAMGNGSDAVKKIAEYITTAVDDDGVQNAMRHYGLIG